MALSLVVALAASMTFQPDAPPGPFEPPVSVEDVLSAWRDGDAGAAGTMAEAYLDYSVAYDGQLAREGAALAFIAAIGSAMREEGRWTVGYWMWVARLHEGTCGGLPARYHEAVSQVMSRPGEAREADRLMRRSPFRAARAAPCRDQSWPIEIPPAPRAPSTPRAIGVFSDVQERQPALSGATRIRDRVGVRLLFEYPSGTVSPALDRNHEYFINIPRSFSLPQGLVIFRPCAPTWLTSDSGTLEICRADQPGSGEE